MTPEIKAQILADLEVQHELALRDYSAVKAAWDAQEAASKSYTERRRSAYDAVYGKLMSEVFAAQRIINTLEGATPEQYLATRQAALEEGQSLLAQIIAEQPKPQVIDINGAGKREHDLAYLIQQVKALL